jgi:hypothetical protein
MIASGHEVGVGKETLLACQLPREWNDILQQDNEDEMVEHLMVPEGKTLRFKILRLQVPC